MSFSKKLGLLLFCAASLATSVALAADWVYVTCRRCNGRGLLCSTCNNTGRMRCPVCNGRGGYNMPGPFGTQMWQICTACDGGTRLCTGCITTAVGCPDCGARGGKLVYR